MAKDEPYLRGLVADERTCHELVEEYELDHQKAKKELPPDEQRIRELLSRATSMRFTRDEVRDRLRKELKARRTRSRPSGALRSRSGKP